VRVVDAPANAYPGEFPGSAVVARMGVTEDLFVSDIFIGLTFRYDPDNVAQPPEMLFSPFGSDATTGLGFQAADSGANPPRPARLLWAVEQEVRLPQGGSRLATRIFSTEVPGLGAMFFSDLQEHGEVDLAGLAQSLGFAPPVAGRLGGIAYHPGRDTIWAVDIVHDVYFELRKSFTAGGSGTDFTVELSREQDGRVVHFFNPLLHPTGGGAYGNSLAYVRLGSGEEFFDLLAGALTDERPTTVVRVHAPADPAAAGVAFGVSSGVGYPVVPNLLREARIPSAFPTAIAYLGDSCGAGQNSEFILVFDTLGGPHTILEVSVDGPSVRNVSDLTCAATSAGSVQVTWTPNDTYVTLEVRRRNLLNTGEPEQEVFRLDRSVDPDPGGFVDATFGFPPDGSYVYVVLTRSPLGARAQDVSCSVTVGRGRPAGTFAFSGGPNNSPTDPAGPPPLPLALTRSPDHVIVVDLGTGGAESFRLPDFQSDGPMAGPFALEGRTSGVAYHPTENRLYWLATVGGQALLQSTLLDGTGLGTRRVVRFPSDLARNPAFGDLSYDAPADQFWVADTRNNVIFAIRADGSFVPDSLIANPIFDGVLSGGVAVAEADAATVTLDIALAPNSTALVDRILRNRYTRTNLSQPEQVHVLEVATTTGSALVGGVEVVSAGTGDDVHDEQLVVGTDTSLVYRLRLDPTPPSGLQLRRGDANNDAALNISDPSFILNFLFRGGLAAPCANAADADDNGLIEITDAIAVFNYLFRGGATPPAPGVDCGFDLTPSDLGCEESVCEGAGKPAA
jgi:hypothetical protein